MDNLKVELTLEEQTVLLDALDSHRLALLSRMGCMGRDAEDFFLEFHEVQEIYDITLCLIQKVEKF